MTAQQGRYGGSVWLATAILTVAAVAQLSMVHFGGYVIAKDAVPLKHPIAQFPETVSQRFTLARGLNTAGVVEGRIQMPDDVVKTLGTKDFISWIYLDLANSEARSQTYIRFHMAYYTAILDAVPHVPDNCMVAGGFLPDPDNTGEVTWTLNDPPAGWEDWKQVNFHRSSFVDARHPDAPGVTAFYIFSVNGEPMWSRRQVRMKVSNAFQRYCYYLKIELSAIRSGGPIEPEEAEAICQDFFRDASDDIFAMLASAEELQQMEDQD